MMNLDVNVTVNLVVKIAFVKLSKSRRVDLDPYVMGYILWSRTAYLL